MPEQFDPTLLDKIPENVRSCAIILSRYFKEQGIDDWALFDVCSRSALERTKSQLDAMSNRLAFETGKW